MYSLYVRKKITINTDPQRRCYNGCNFSEEDVWTNWEFIYSSSKENVEESAHVFKELNPKREYKIRMICDEDEERTL